MHLRSMRSHWLPCTLLLLLLLWAHPGTNAKRHRIRSCLRHNISEPFLQKILNNLKDLEEVIVDINIHIRLIPEINWNLRNKIGVFAIKDLLDFYLQQVLKADSHIGKETAELKSHLSRLQTTVKDCIKFTTPSKKYNTTYGEKITDMKKNFKNTDELISKAVGELHLVIEGIHQYTLPRKL